MSNVTCKEAKDKVYDYLAQEVSHETRESINIHLKDCVGCAGEYAVELQISSLISSSSLNSTSTDELVNRAFAQIELEE
jgi:mycothiol system anti-sigma-R factor